MKHSESVLEFCEIFLSLGLLTTQIQMQTMIVNTPVRFRKVLGPEESWKFTWFFSGNAFWWFEMSWNAFRRKDFGLLNKYQKMI